MLRYGSTGPTAVPCAIGRCEALTRRRALLCNLPYTVWYLTLTLRQVVGPNASRCLTPGGDAARRRTGGSIHCMIGRPVGWSWPRCRQVSLAATSSRRLRAATEFDGSGQCAGVISI